jgi:hypothetical protein
MSLTGYGKEASKEVTTGVEDQKIFYAQAFSHS